MTYNCTTPEEILKERSWPFSVLCTVLFLTSTLLLLRVTPRLISSVAIGCAVGWGVWWTLGGPQDVSCDAVAWITASVSLLAFCLSLCLTRLALFLLASSGVGAIFFHILPILPIPQEPSIRQLAVYPSVSVAAVGLLGGSLTCACRKTSETVIALISGSAGVVLGVKILTSTPWYGLLGIFLGVAALGVVIQIQFARGGCTKTRRTVSGE